MVEKSRGVRVREELNKKREKLTRDNRKRRGRFPR